MRRRHVTATGPIIPDELAIGAIALLVIVLLAKAALGQSCNPSDARRLICPVCARDGVASRVYEGAYPGYPYGVPHATDDPPVRYWNGTTLELVPAVAVDDHSTGSETTPEPLEFADENGCVHVHRLNNDTFHCSRGHEFVVYTEHCWCGWPTINPVITRE